MHLSVAWLNSLLHPALPALSADEVDSALMSLGFPSEGRTLLPDGDTCLDVEVTSNRGDVLCHMGMASEVAAKYERGLSLLPTIARHPVMLGEQGVQVENPDHDLCPRFTAQVIRGVAVGESPRWLRERLEAVGQRSINNVVDVTNYIALELGNPCHVFDLRAVEGGRLIVRFAREKEQITTLDGKPRVLASDQLVVADATKAQSLAGVMGGAASQVKAATTDIVLEMATWDPATVRRTARAHGIRTDAGHRFERTVDAGTIDVAAERAANMIIEVAGGKRVGGLVDVGQPAAARREITLRPSRCNQIMGAALAPKEIVTFLNRLDIQCALTAESNIIASIPFQRCDLTREIDLIEEVARLAGLDSIGMLDAIAVAVRPPQERERARRELASTLAGLGFYETVTFSFISPAAASAWVPTGLRSVQVSEDRRKNEPVCRPSVVPGLLASRRTNQHGGVMVPGGIRLYEVSAVFAQAAGGGAVERTNLALLMDVSFAGKRASIGDLQRGIRLMRGAIEAIVRTLAGSQAVITLREAASHCPGMKAEGYAAIQLGEQLLGYMGLVSDAQLSAYDLTSPVVVCEVDVHSLLSLYPPRTYVAVPPAFPGIERDVSFIVDEATTWGKISSELASLKVPLLEKVAFISTFRGAQIGKAKKSITVRFTFRDQERTLRHEEVDPPVAQLVEHAQGSLGAVLRA